MMQLCFIIMRLLSAFANVIEAFARRVAKRGVKRCRPRKHYIGTSSIERLPLRMILRTGLLSLKRTLIRFKRSRSMSVLVLLYATPDAGRIFTVQVRY